MSNELMLALKISGQTIEAEIVDEDRSRRWNGSAMVLKSSITDANWRTGMVACTELLNADSSPTGDYVGDWPATLTTVGQYVVLFYISPSATGDRVVGLQYEDLRIGEIYSKTGTLGTGAVTVQSPVATDLTVSIYPYDDYHNSDARALDWTNTAGTWAGGDITGAAVAFTAVHKISGAVINKAGSVVTPTGEQKVRVQLTSAETAAFVLDRYDYQVRLTLVSGRKITIVDSKVDIIKSLFTS